jgi:hypothetical protein
LHDFITSQDDIFEKCSAELYQLHNDLKTIKVQAFDLLTSVDVLTTGMYQRLRIKDSNKLLVNNIISNQSLKLILLKQPMPSFFRKNMKVNGKKIEISHSSLFSLKLLYIQGFFSSSSQSQGSVQT